MALEEPGVFVARLTTEELASALAAAGRCAVLVPVGAIEPHGPHLPLDTDLIISRAAAVRAVATLRGLDIAAFVAPDACYGVTECASDFAGAVSVPAPAVIGYLHGVAEGWLRAGFGHVCLVNNHLEPAHDGAVRAAVATIPGGRASVASPLTKRWARTLSEEFKRGACHAGEYETSIVLAASPADVREELLGTMPDVDISLSENLKKNVARFREMGMDRGYAGAPGRATQGHGETMLQRLAEMIVGEITDALGA